jgi:DNA helicase-2/ATP-dependent DNA helicase PcrA
MHLVADLHIHSHFSRATSKDLTLEQLWRWAQLKGVDVVATGDIAHPGWLLELSERLTPAEDGLFTLKPEYTEAAGRDLPAACRRPVRFLLGGEISNIYKRGGKTRKVHNLVFLPTLAAVARLQTRLERIGNIRADGRPILGLDSRDLLEIVLETDSRGHFIPAHIWTPWFAMLGSMSGFDSVEECFADLTPHIFALETGLSSDPPMNWRVANLDRYTLVSNSDAHSPQKLAREATLFAIEPGYAALFGALHSGDPAHFRGTVEFFPEEGKYHLDGHRACGVCWEPPVTRAHGGLCSVCGKPVTVGVMHRVELLADRPEGGQPPRPHPFYSLAPLPEILGEVYAVGAGSKRVNAEYFKLLGKLGPELTILMDAPPEAIAAVGGPRLATAIFNMRRGAVTRRGGYDGEYGVIRLLDEDAGQTGLFLDAETQSGRDAQRNSEGPLPQEFSALPQRLRASASEQVTPFDAEAQSGRDTQRNSEEPLPQEFSAPPQRLRSSASESLPPLQADLFSLTPDSAATSPLAIRPSPLAIRPSPLLSSLNDDQRAAVACTDRPLVIVAGPGTGKTRTLTVRIAHLIASGLAAPETVLAVTFTNKAAAEMAERLAALLDPDVARRITVQTFHAFGAALLREHAAAAGLPPDFVILDEEERRRLLRQAAPALPANAADALLRLIAAAKNQLLAPDAPALADLPDADPRLPEIYAAYEAALRTAGALDYDDLVARSVQLLARDLDLRARLTARYHWISVDEYQDVNLAQYRLLRLLAGAGAGAANLCVIGDPDQSIYGFRGADRGYFLRFRSDYPDAAEVRLSRNYRSSQLILAAAHQVIARSPDWTALRVWSDFVATVKVDVYRAPTDKAEAEYVVHQIEQMVGGTSYFSLDSGRVDDHTAPARSFGDFAVLYRLSAQSQTLLEAFARSGIPCQCASQQTLYDLPHVRRPLALLWLLHNSRSRLHWETALVDPASGLSAASFDRLWPQLEAADDIAAQLADLATAAGNGRGARAALAQWAEFWPHFTRLAGAPVVDQLGAAAAFLGQNGAALDAAQAADLRTLHLRAAAYGERLAEFLQATALQTEGDWCDPRADRVALLTLHAAKGLEFPVVFVVGCEDGLLPYRRPGRATDLAEERRLFYVGMTRARERLIFTHAGRRLLYGQRMANPISPFVEDIEQAIKEVREPISLPAPPPRPAADQLSLF